MSIARTALFIACRLLLPMSLVGCGNASAPAASWIAGARVVVDGESVTNKDCRAALCRHNENTDLIVYQGAIYFVHRTAFSQVLGPNSALHVYRSTDQGKSFVETAVILAPAPMTALGGMAGRDLRDPHFFQIGATLFIKALTRLPVTSARDSDVDTVPVITSTTDGTTFTPLASTGIHGWSFWRIREYKGVQYTAAYQDGDKSVVLYSSTDGMTWTPGADIYTMAADTPLETELTFMPSGRLLALVRMDGTDQELFGSEGRLRTKVCWAMPPYASFACPQELTGQRLDGPLSIPWQGHLFHVARKHLSMMRKRTALFEIMGHLEGGPLDIREIGELPSGGDTAYAGAAPIDANRFLVTWYSGDVMLDESWVLGMLDNTDIRAATIDLSVAAEHPTR